MIFFIITCPIHLNAPLHTDINICFLILVTIYYNTPNIG